MLSPSPHPPQRRAPPHAAPAPSCPPAAPLHRSTHHCRARQPRRPPCPFCRCRYPLCCSPQRRYPPRRPIKPRIPSLHCGGPRPSWQESRRMRPLSPNARNKPPSWQHLRLMHAFRGKNGKILAPCIHFRVRSGGFGCMARKSCRQGRLFASRGPRSCMARRTCQRCSTSS